jgi:hypothetical protein
MTFPSPGSAPRWATRDRFLLSRVGRPASTNNQEKNMPPKTTRTKRTDWYICAESFAGNDITISAGTRLRGNDSIVKTYGHHFEREMEPGESLAGIRARRAERLRHAPEVEVEVEQPAQPDPVAKGKVRLRVLGHEHAPLVLGTTAGPELSGRAFLGGQTFDLDHQQAEAILGEVGAWLEVVEPETEGAAA